MFGKLSANPKTARHLADPGFVNTLHAVQKNPILAQGALQDPRMIECMGVLMGIDLNAFAGKDAPENFGASASSPPPRTPSSNPAYSSKPEPASSSKVQEDVPMAEEEDDDPEAAEEKKLKAEAEELKKTGGDAYRKRDFPAAIAAYEKAWEVWPKDITYLTNLSAVYFEQGDYDKCIETCEKAIEEGRPLRADYKLIAKAYGRIGNASHKKGDLAAAIKNYEKSLTEHRTPDILNKLRDVEREKKAADEAAYIDPELSEKAREEGNKEFKAGDFVAAVKSYTESIKRDPKDPRGYNNRALCYTKLAALPEALKDTEKAIEVDPTFSIQGVHPQEQRIAIYA
ncbi:TPR-like protein [Schizopora paradoxa]|uniref:TPR-like protein n=1 Tax=Schizopora paradoxa TaxID=27342 RepID=A0A0H2SGZ9_9AGAM|nr:TPR-like protein [Schizopora paradoxa]